MNAKFQMGDRATANDKAPGDYSGRIGTVLQHKTDTSEYQVQFDGDSRGPSWLSSWMLDRVSSLGVSPREIP